MTRKPSHSKADPASEERRQQGGPKDHHGQQGGHKDPLHPLPALPLPKRPATKPDVTRKPPAITPEDDQAQPIMGLSDKTSHYSNVSSQNKRASSAKSNMALPVAPSLPPNPNSQALSTAPSAPKQSGFSPQVSSDVPQKASKSSETSQKAPKSSAPALSPPNLLSPIPGNLSTNPFLDLIHTEDTTKSISQSFSGEIETSRKNFLTFSESSGLSVQPPVPPSNILTHSNDHNLIESLPLPNKPAPRCTCLTFFFQVFPTTFQAANLES